MQQADHMSQLGADSCTPCSAMQVFTFRSQTHACGRSHLPHCILILHENKVPDDDLSTTLDPSDSNSDTAAMHWQPQHHKHGEVVQQCSGTLASSWSERPWKAGSWRSSVAAGCTRSREPAKCSRFFCLSIRWMTSSTSASSISPKQNAGWVSRVANQV